MLKVWLINFLLSRGVSALQEYLSKTVRNGVVATGVALAANGHPLTQDATQTLVGAGLIVVGVGLDYARTLVAKMAESKGAPVGVIKSPAPVVVEGGSAQAPQQP